MIDPKKQKQSTQQFIFAVLWIVKACVLYVFCDEFVKLAMREELNGIKLYSKLNVHNFWLIAACIIGAGILIDLAMLLASLFSKRVAVGFLALSFFIHNVVIIPQHITGNLIKLFTQYFSGLYMATHMGQENSIEIGWKTEFDGIEKECKENGGTEISQYPENSKLVTTLMRWYNNAAKIQKALGCCGWTNSDDWNSAKYCSNVRLEPKMKPRTTKSIQASNSSIFGLVGKVDPSLVIPWWGDANKVDSRETLPDSCCKRKINFEREIGDDKSCDSDGLKDRWSSTGCEKAAKDLITRVLKVFSYIIISVELIYFLVSILFYLFLIWKPIAKSPSSSEELGLVNRVASPSNTFRGSKTSALQNVFTSEKEETQDKDKDATQDKDKDATQDKDKDATQDKDKDGTQKTKQTTTQNSVDK